MSNLEVVPWSSSPLNMDQTLQAVQQSALWILEKYNRPETEGVIYGFMMLSNT